MTDLARTSRDIEQLYEAISELLQKVSHHSQEDVDRRIRAQMLRASILRARTTQHAERDARQTGDA
jgi:hypothetical protein